MSRSFFRGFGIACLFIGITFLALGKWDPALLPIGDQKQFQQLQKELEDANEQISQLKNQLDTSIHPNESNGDSSNFEEQEHEVVEDTLYIYSGMTPYEVGKKLEDMGIVENAIEMELFLSKPEYARSIQKGQFTVSSEMTLEEIANLITGKSNNAPDS